MLDSRDRYIDARIAHQRKVTVTCYGRATDYPSRKAAIAFFAEAVNGCDPQSSECGRYQRILNRLYAGQSVVSDEY